MKSTKRTGKGASVRVMRSNPMRRVRPSTATPELDAYGARVVAKQNADGWLRLRELLKKAGRDPRISAAPHAADFVELVFDLAESASGSAYDAVQPIMRLAVDTLQAERGKHAADVRHSKPGGSRDKAELIRQKWASGKYSSRDVCAERECAALKMSFSSARKALRNTPRPT